MSLPAWVQVILSGLTLLATALVIPVLRHLRIIRENELHHVGEALKRLEDSSMRIEDKLDHHIEWHMDHKNAN